jgi:hypothetical protein
LLLSAVDAEVADLLVGGDEVRLEVLADFVLGQGVRTERLGVVSGERCVLEIARDVQDELQAHGLFRQLGRLCEAADEFDGRPTRLNAAARTASWFRILDLAVCARRFLLRVV